MQNNFNTTQTSSTNTPNNALNVNPPHVESSEGWFSFSYAKELAFNSLVNHLTTPTKNSLGENKVKKIEGPWGDLLLDLAGYAGAKLSINNEDTIHNISLLIQEVLFALGAVREEATQELNSPDFGRHLIANFLGELFKHDLSNFELDIKSEKIKASSSVSSNESKINPVQSESKNIVEGLEEDGDSQSIEFEGEKNADQLDSVTPENGKILVLPKKQSKGGEKELKIELGRIFDNLMLNAGLDKDHLQDRHELIRDALDPGIFVQALLWGARASGQDIPKIEMNELKITFIKWGVELCKIQKRLEIKSHDPILDPRLNEGTSELADYVVEELIKSLHEEGLSIEFPFLVKKKNKEFLSSVINLVLTNESGEEKEVGIISQAWEIISQQLKIAIKAILAVVLTPTQKNETAEERRNHLLDGILNRLVDQSKAFTLKIAKIDKSDKKTLVALITELSRVEGQYQLEAKKLLERQNLVWQNEAQAFYKKAWHRNDKLTLDELLIVLKGWKEYSETSDSWTALNSKEAEALLARETLTWENEAQNFLKVIEYDELAQSVLGHELSVEKFSDFFPTMYPASKVFQPLYQLIGEKSFELHEHISNLKIKGEEASAYLQKINGKLTVFTDSLLTGFITAMEEKASTDEEVLDLGYPFLNAMVTHLIKKPNEGEVNAAGKELVKTQVKSVVEDVIMTVLADTIQNNCTEAREAADVFPFLINQMIEKALKGFDNTTEFCKTAMEDDFDREFTAIAMKGITDELSIKAIKLKDTKEERVQQVKELLIKVLARNLISILLPQKLFNSLLPPMFRKSNLWDMIGDKLIAPYLSDIYEKLEVFQFANDNADSEEAKRYHLHDGIRKKVFPMIDTLVEKMNTGVSSFKFNELLKSKDKEKSQLDFSILDEYFGKALEKNGQISQLIELAVPSILESIFAFHLNPKGEKTSQDLVTDLLWNLLNASSKCSETIDSFKSAVLSGKDVFLAEEFLSKKHLAILAAYRKEKKINPSTEMTANDLKKCYIWAQTNQFLTDTVNDLMDQLVPEELWNERVPEHFRKLLTRAQVGNLLFDYLKEWYEFSTKMKALMHSGKEHVGTGNGSEDATGFIEDKVKAFLADFCIVKDSDKPDEVWQKEILNDLLMKEGSAIRKPITNLAIKYAYAILGKVLSGHLFPDLTNSEILIKSLTDSNILEEFTFENKKGSSEMLEINELRPAVQIAYKKLDALEDDIGALTCENFSQISRVNLEMYLRTVHKPDLRKNEKVRAFSNSFTIENDNIVFKVQVQNTETKEEREISLDFQTFIHWELVYRTFAFNNEKSSSLVLKVNELVPAIQESFHKLNALSNKLTAHTCEDFAQISNTNLNLYISADQEAVLQKDEVILGFSKTFDLEENRIVFKVQIQNSKNKKEREVSLDLYNFIYWELAYKSIGSLIPKDGWKELMPEFLTKVFPKENLAKFAVPYIEFAHRMQAPVQNNAEKGESLVNELVAEERSKRRSLQALDLETNVLPLGSLRRDPLERPMPPLNKSKPRGPVNKHHKHEGLGLIDSKENEKRLENSEKASTDLDAFIDVMIFDNLWKFMTDFSNENKSSSKKGEALVLGAILSNPEHALASLKLVKEDDFFDPIHKAIFKAIKEVFSEKKVVDGESVINKLKANRAFEIPNVDNYIKDLVEQKDTSTNFKANCEELKKLTLKRQKPLIEGLPVFIDSLLREFLTTKVNVNVKQIRETLTKRAVYLIISEFLKPADRDEKGKETSAIKNSADNVRKKLKSIVDEYALNNGNPHNIAQKMVDEVIPKKTWDAIFTDEEKNPIALEDIVTMVEKFFVNDTCVKIIALENKQIKAKKIIENLDRTAGLVEGKLGGLSKVVGTICTSIDSTLDEYFEKKVNILDQPLLVNEIAKGLFRDETISGVVKESAHALVNICIAKLFRVKEGEAPEIKLLGVLARMVDAYDTQDFTKTAASWLKEVVPEKLRKALLPDFLHGVITHEFLAEAIFKEYMIQIKDVAGKIESLDGISDENVINMQGFVKDKLVALKNENSRDGLAGFGGFVKNLEKVFLEVLDGDYDLNVNLKDIGPFVNKIFNANIAQVMTQPNVVDILKSETFLSEALAAALPMLGTVEDPEGYVELTDDQLEDLSSGALKKLGIALPRNENEEDADFRVRVKKWHFEVKSGEILAEILFPSKAASLLVLEIAQDSVWNNVIEALGNQVGRVTNKDSRILLAINLLGIDQENNEDKDAFKDLEEHLIDNKNLVGKEVIAEGLFKKGLKKLAMEKVDGIFADWPAWLAPITWIARMFTKVVVSLALHFGVSQQAWNFVSSVESDEKLRRLIWKLLSFTKAYKPKVVNSDELSEELGNKVKKVMEDVNLLNGLQWFVGPRAAAAFKDKQVLSFLFENASKDFESQ